MTNLNREVVSYLPFNLEVLKLKKSSKKGIGWGLEEQSYSG
ncbi:MAG: hypothetical protein ABGW77_04785 [Campylobacterales bacterium]